MKSSTNKNPKFVQFVSQSYQEARQIELKMRRLVQEALMGGYRSAFRGVGLDFDEVRPYTPGDDIRHINWPVTARANQPYVKRYVEERQQTLLLLVDVSGSTAFGGGQEKRELALELTAVFATAAHHHQDRVGLLLFSDQVEAFIKPSQGRNHSRTLIHTLLTTTPQGKGTDIAHPLQIASRILKRPAIVLLLSDFLASPAQWQAPLSQLSRRHDVVVLHLQDPSEQLLPAVGLLALHDSETGERIWVDTNDPRWQAGMAAQTQAQQQAIAQTCQQARADYLLLPTNTPWLATVTHFLQHRPSLTQRGRR